MSNPSDTGERLIAGKEPLDEDGLLIQTNVDEYYNRVPVTYGVEMQFLATVYPGRAPNPLPEQRPLPIYIFTNKDYNEVQRLTVRLLVVDVFRKAGLPA